MCLRKNISATHHLTDLRASLKSINETLWDIEDDIRLCEQRGDFGDKFIKLARSVYRQNDKRAAVKKEINVLLGSSIIEEKSTLITCKSKMTNRFKDKVDAIKWLVLLLGLSVFLPAGLIAKQSMAVIFIIVIITLFFCTLLTRPSDLSPDRKVLLLFLTLCVYISFTHYLNDSCAPA